MWDVVFGHKVNLATGKGNLIIDCHIPKGKGYWSVLAYNFRVLTNMTLSRIAGTA